MKFWTHNWSHETLVRTQQEVAAGLFRGLDHSAGERFGRVESGDTVFVVNWSGGSFHLDRVTSTLCSDDPAITANPPAASFDTITGTGVGRYNGSSGATVQFVLSDGGEPGRNDVAAIRIKDASGRVVLNVNGRLSNGNQHAHDRCASGDHAGDDDDHEHSSSCGAKDRD